MSVYFAFTKILSRPANYYWRHKTPEVRNFLEGYLRFRKPREWNQKIIQVLKSIGMPDMMCKSMTTGFVVHLPRDRNGKDEVKIRFDLLSIKKISFLLI